MANQGFVADAPAHRWLESKGNGWQFGEQGILDAMLECLGDHSRRCMEIGAGDGVTLPVTVDRLIQRGWECRLYEIAAYRQDQLRARYREAADVRGAWPGKFEAADRWLDGGVAVIDVDGRDVLILDELLSASSPAVVICEHYDKQAPSQPGPGEGGLPPTWLLGKPIDGGFTIQACHRLLAGFAGAHGYDRIGTTRVNSIFVRSDLKRRLFHV